MSPVQPLVSSSGLLFFFFSSKNNVLKEIWRLGFGPFSCNDWYCFQLKNKRKEKMKIRKWKRDHLFHSSSYVLFGFAEYCFSTRDIHYIVPIAGEKKIKEKEEYRAIKRILFVFTPLHLFWHWNGFLLRWSSVWRVLHIVFFLVTYSCV